MNHETDPAEELVLDDMAERLRASLEAHADTVHPSDDGLARIRARLDAAGSTADERAPSRRLPMWAGVAAALALVVGGTLYVTSRPDGQEVAVSTADASTTSAPASVESDLPPLDDATTATDDAAPGTGEAVAATPSTLPFPDAPAGVLGPRAVDPEAAARAFLDLVQRGDEPVVIEIDGAVARVLRMVEDGSTVHVTDLSLGAVDLGDGSPGVVVVRADAPSITIESPSPSAVIETAALSVAGRGSGFEAMLDVELYSSDDGVFLSRSYATAGSFGELAPYEAELRAAGRQPAWLVVASSGGEDRTIDPFTAVPLQLDAPLGDPVLSVAVPVSDPDGGLVVRATPGPDGRALGVLAPGAEVIRRADLAAFVRDGDPVMGEPTAGDEPQEWWNVWLPEPLDGRTSGWVNRRYLAVDRAPSDEVLVDLAQQYRRGIQGDLTAFAGLPWSPDGVAIGSPQELTSISARTVAAADFWTTARGFALPDAYAPSRTEAEPRDFLSPIDGAGTDTEIDLELLGHPSGGSPYGNDQQVLASTFGGSGGIQLVDPMNDDSGWRTVSLFVAEGASGPEIVGVVAVTWSP